MPINLDEIKTFLHQVQAGATEDPAAFATTAITHFKKLLDTSILLAGAVEHQTRAIAHLLETDLATVTTPPLLPAGPESAPTAGTHTYIPVPVYLNTDGRPLQMPGWTPPAQPGWTPPVQASPQPETVSGEQALLQAQLLAQQTMHMPATPPPAPLPSMWEGSRSVRRDHIG